MNASTGTPRFEHPGTHPKCLAPKVLRLPYIPLPYTIYAFGLSHLTKIRRDVHWGKIRRQVYQRWGEACYYCGVQPIPGHHHDCHEVFKIDAPRGIIRLVEIVPACHSCHEWADGRKFVDGLLGRYLYMTFSQLRGYLRPFISPGDPEWPQCGDVQQYEASRHFRRVNRLSIAETRRYLLEAYREHTAHNRSRCTWQVDYGAWSESAGFAPGEKYRPPRKPMKHVPSSRLRVAPIPKIRPT